MAFIKYRILNCYYIFSSAADKAGIPKENIAIMQLDQSQSDCGKVVEEIIKKEGRVDVLVNNAGFGYHGTIIVIYFAKYQLFFFFFFVDVCSSSSGLGGRVAVTVAVAVDVSVAVAVVVPRSESESRID